MSKLTEKQIDDQVEEQIGKFDTLAEAVTWLRFLQQGGEPHHYGSGGITCFRGRMGGGMTLAAVAFAYWEHLKGKPVYSNMQLNFPSKPLSRINFNTIASSVILIDSAYMTFDGRNSMSKANRLWAYLFMQARRRGLSVYLTTPDISYLDIRIRRLLDVTGMCANPRKDYFEVRLTDHRTGIRRKMSLHGTAYYRLYDTLKIPKVNKLKP